MAVRRANVEIAASVREAEPCEQCFIWPLPEKILEFRLRR